MVARAEHSLPRSLAAALAVRDSGISAELALAQIFHRANPTMSPRILVPIDFGVHSDELLRTAARYCRGCKAHLTLLHVCESERAGASSCAPLRSMVLLEEARQQLQETGQTLVDLALTQGSAAREIVRFAREGTFDLIILGEQSRESESLAERIRGRAPCAVMSVRLPSEKHGLHQPSSALIATFS
jgi:nucleotide-binding universal stress UspA family protein